MYVHGSRWQRPLAVPTCSHMIERQKIEGRDATVAYLTADFAPASADTAALVKVIYDGGEMVVSTFWKSILVKRQVTKEKPSSACGLRS